MVNGDRLAEQVDNLAIQFLLRRRERLLATWLERGLLQRLVSGVIKQGVVPEDEVEGEGRLPGMVDATNDLEIIG